MATASTHANNALLWRPVLPTSQSAVLISPATPLFLSALRLPAVREATHAATTPAAKKTSFSAQKAQAQAAPSVLVKPLMYASMEAVPLRLNSALIKPPTVLSMLLRNVQMVAVSPTALKTVIQTRVQATTALSVDGCSVATDLVPPPPAAVRE